MLRPRRRGASQAQADGKIGFVNIERILRDAAPAVRAQKKLEAEFSKREQELAKIGRAAQADAGDAREERVTMSEAERAQEGARVRRPEPRLPAPAARVPRGPQPAPQRGAVRVLERANRAIRQIAEAEKFDIIFQEAVYASPRIDITDKVIKALDDSAPGEEVGDARDRMAQGPFTARRDRRAARRRAGRRPGRRGPPASPRSRSAGPGELAFLASPKYRRELAATRAGA